MMTPTAMVVAGVVAGVAVAVEIAVVDRQTLKLKLTNDGNTRVLVLGHEGSSAQAGEVLEGFFRGDQEPGRGGGAHEDALPRQHAHRAVPHAA
jgi:hypothetical protein